MDEIHLPYAKGYYKMNIDNRPDPKPRKHAHLWQSYLFWHELVEMRKRHLLRISSIEAGKSNLDAQLEKDFMSDMQIDLLINKSKKNMITFGDEVGEIWKWITSIKGLGEGSLAAQLLAQIDNIGKFDTISKLWRFAGQAVIDGKAERNKPGEKAHKNALLQAICWNIGEQFVKQQTPLYSDIYYSEKERLRRLHPETITNGNGKKQYNDGHLHNMAKRKAVKIFLQHLWIKWRGYEGLPISQPYVQAILGHTNIIEAPNYE